MREMFTSNEFFIGLGVLTIVFILNELLPTVPQSGMRLIAVGIGAVTWLSYRGFL